MSRTRGMRRSVYRLIGEQRRRQRRQSGILGTAGGDFAIERRAARNYELIHKLSRFLSESPTRRRYCLPLASNSPARS